MRRRVLKKVHRCLLLIAVLFFGIIGYAMWPDIKKLWLPPPIYIPDAEAHWINERQFDITAPTFYWNDSCPSIWVTWSVQTQANGSVPITTHAVSGPFKASGELPPRYQISITPKVGPPLHLRGTIPEWLDRREVLLVSVDDTVPDNAPCASGWTGVMHVFQLQVES